MCRKKTVQGLCCACFGFGLLVGYALEGWWLTSAGGMALILFGLMIITRR